MPKVIAKAEIHRTIKPGKAATATSPAVKPEIEIIAPGTAFVAEGEELAALRRARAVRDPEGPAAAVPSAQAEDAPAPAATAKPKKTTSRSPKTSKPKSEPAASTTKTTDKDDGAGEGTENDGDNGAGDGNEGDAADTDLV